MKIFIKSSAILFIVAASYIAKAQETKSFTVKNFSSIGVSSGIDLYLTQGGSESVNVKADSEILKDIVVEQSGSNVTIKFKDGINWGSMFKNRTIKAYVSFKSLNAIAASGGSDVFTQNQIKTDKLAIRSSGGSDLKLSVVCKDLSIQSSGGSDIDLKGKAENMTIQSSGGSDIDAYELIADYAKVQASGGSDVNLYVNKGLEASASGGGDVSYKGNASLKKTSSSKSGDVHHVN
ncbi:Putative auto-transporter adhesin, head GIN domain [Pedobacter suwonensis]|uniref:Putative auto-transporter adhesin, head GIN domain n=1 Tax=Pedobacter suwonensis TaxID=332999 RepID=A0A1I0TZ94_9SPHI|nr:head GIN domain-containing protein [Pedobacter suwonensis]SFA57104.1 Putative auto-transporter adhesin, head GIN domain [Pedobacter suwonensis]